MRVSLILLGGVVVLSAAVARALSCVCSPLECDVLTKDDCPGGLTWDPCKCCQVCARVEGEPCGGLFGFSGSCAVGLQCVIRNLLDHAREVDEGTCTKIPGRWRRRHCPGGPKLSEPGCNLVDEGVAATGAENAAGVGKCVCGPAILWCPGETQPYTFRTRHECKLNLAAKIAYDDLFNAPEKDMRNGIQGSDCPVDSVTTEDGKCKCSLPCPPHECRPGQHPIQVRPASPETPRRCCPLYDCVSSEPISWLATEEGQGPGTCIDNSGLPRSTGDRWQEGPCVSCACEDGHVSCQATMCKSCEKPTPPSEGECCPHCPPTPHANATAGKCEPPTDCELHCEAGFVKDDNDCPTCVCEKEKTAEESGSSPTDKICPELPHCGLNCALVKDEGGCPVCACQDSHSGTIVPPESEDKSATGEPEEAKEEEEEEEEDTEKTVCPALSCDLHCERGLVMDEDGCTLCECRVQTGCSPLTGCKKKCPAGFKTNKRGCQTCRCRATCVDHRNNTRPEGSTWSPDSCTRCSCDSSGRLSCKETVCSVGCSDPLPPMPGTCCPVCPIAKVPPEKEGSHATTRGWGTAPTTVIVVLAVLCVLLMIHIVRNRFRGRLSPSEVTYASYPPQYYKCVPVYDTPVHQSEKIVPL